MAVRIQFRRGSKADWEGVNPVLAQGELGYETTDKIIKFGDGQSTWLNLPVAAAGDIMSVKAGSGLRYGTGTTNGTLPTAGESGNVVLEVDPNVVLTAATITAKGDTVFGTGAGAYAVVPVGATNGHALVVDNTTATGVAWGQVSDPLISSGYITAANLATNAVSTSKIANGAVTADKLASNSVTEVKVLDGAISTAKLADGSITEPKIASNAVTTTKINNLAVTSDKLAANAVTAAKVSTDVYQRATTSFTSSSARIFINNNAATNPPTGSPGDIWFRYV